MKYFLLAALSLAACKKGPIGDLPNTIVGSCTYVNPFSKREECRAYLGTWTEADATKDCADQDAAIVLGADCAYPSTLGYCVLGSGEKVTRVDFPGDSDEKCGSSKTGCELFGGGTFAPSAVCGGAAPSADLGLDTFQQATKSCGADGICTWVMISGATKLGEDFSDHADCAPVYTQRPYYPAKTEDNAEQEDARLQDPIYAAELAWVKEQVKAAACVCCHSTRAPKGPSNWYLESPGNFMNSFYGTGLAMGAGWINSVGFGAYPPEDNNGFFRPTLEHPEGSIFPTTDTPRMVAFFEAELAHRGLTRADFANKPYAAGPLDDQRFFRPAACENGEGVDASGTLIWAGGDARYVYVLDPEARSPTVPPNLDLPEGTRWRIDVPATGKGVASGSVRYGALPEGTSQRFPTMGAPAALESGKPYYLYVLYDVAVPITRCLFNAP